MKFFKGKYAYGFWVACALFVGVFIVSFSIDASTHLVSILFFDGQNSDVPHMAASSTAVSLPDLGSNDSADIDDAVNTTEPSDAGLAAYIIKNASTKQPKITAKEYLVGDINTGQILIEKNGTTQYPIASVTKLMTILVAREVENLQSVTTLSQAAIDTYGAQGELKAGQKMVVGDLEYPLLLESSNDAAEALADVYGRNAFLEKMNEKAAQIGMFNTWYEDPSGLTPKNVTTVEDLFKLASYIHTVMPEIYDTTRVRQYSILGHTWTNENYFLALSSFAGGKNGYTDEALETSVALFNLALVPGSKDTHTVVIALLQSTDREDDVYSLLSYLKNYVSLVPNATSTATSTASTTTS